MKKRYTVNASTGKRKVIASGNHKQKTHKAVTAAWVYKEGLQGYEPWSGARDTWRNLEKYDCLDALEQFIDEVYYDESAGEGVINETDLNDLLWFEPEVVYEAVGLYYDPDSDEVSDEPFDTVEESTRIGRNK